MSKQIDAEANNIRMVCIDCLNQLKAETQKTVVDKLKELRGQGKTIYVKASFQDEGNEFTEHMWLKVGNIDYASQKFEGTLDNIPIFLKNFSWGDKFDVDFSEIEDIYGIEKEKAKSKRYRLRKSEV